ncbi:MAG: hypothetical protein NXI04_06820 [Planctomycetaceae bacterium]|nr:hypothetical protein [Planctomycetaceae bacterium]
MGPSSTRITSAASAFPPHRIIILLMMCGSLSGCVNPMFTRLPSYWTYHPTSEARAYEQQDPFPDPDIGPEVSSRPRGYDRPRTAPRKAAEQRLLYGTPYSPENIPPGYPQGGLQRPAAVY